MTVNDKATAYICVCVFKQIYIFLLYYYILKITFLYKYETYAYYCDEIYKSYKIVETK